MSTRLRYSAIPLIAIAFIALSLQAQSAGSDQDMKGMAHMAGHMYLTSLRPIQPGDKARADAIVALARQAMEPYQDYHKALADGYRIFLPNIPQPLYHFTLAGERPGGAYALRSPQANLAALHENSRRRLQAHRRHVHRPRRCQ